MARVTSDPKVNELQEALSRPAFNRWLNVKAECVDDASTVISIAFRPELGFHETESIFHGGVIASLVDIAGYYAVAMKHVNPTPTAGLQIEYLAPAKGKKIVASARCRSIGRTISRVDVDVLDDQDRLVAIGRGTFSTKGERK